MAITISTAMPTSFKVELFKGLHDLQNGADALKIALLKSQSAGSGTYGAATTNYSTVTGNSDETTNTSGSAYSAGGNTLTNVTPTSDGTTAICDFADTTWSSASFTTCGAVIYNTNNSNSAVAVLSFGGDQTVSSGDFQIQFPAAAASTAIIRIA
jgi:hypothetical protein|tara:strand:- start:476 stop:940 length:465 start_codon:yes stop_codon:yes gene_type:complete